MLALFTRFVYRVAAMLRTICVSVIALTALGWLGANDYADALILDAIEKEARPARVVAADRSLPFAIPIDYKAAICQRQYYGERPTCRYYAERTK